MAMKDLFVKQGKSEGKRAAYEIRVKKIEEGALRTADCLSPEYSGRVSAV
jgi:hypothetical protein